MEILAKTESPGEHASAVAIRNQGRSVHRPASISRLLHQHWAVDGRRGGVDRQSTRGRNGDVGNPQWKTALAMSGSKAHLHWPRSPVWVHLRQRQAEPSSVYSGQGGGLCLPERQGRGHNAGWQHPGAAAPEGGPSQKIRTRWSGPADRATGSLATKRKKVLSLNVKSRL